MKGGDLSNEVAPTLAIRFERVLRTEEGKLNRSAKAYLQSLRNIDINVVIITTKDSRKAAAFCYKWGIPYQRIVECDSTLEIPQVCREMDVLTYYDFDIEILQNVNSRGHGKIDVREWIIPEV